MKSEAIPIAVVFAEAEQSPLFRAVKKVLETVASEIVLEVRSSDALLPPIVGSAVGPAVGLVVAWSDEDFFNKFNRMN
ncbi:MAG: hypothetical protein WCN95_11340, partial [bacterium]